MPSTSTGLILGPKQITLAETTGGAFREYIDTFDGYTFLYPKSWIQVKGAGANIFFRDPFVLDENMPSGEGCGEKVLKKQYLTEFRSTRLVVRRESNVLSVLSKVADDGKLYYEVKVNIKSYASNHELAVMPQDRNKWLYELRLQTPEQVFMQEEDLRRVMDSFRVTKAA
uniref:PsbP C-terminal domain-containing protein n=1 Tax=Setaria viridis TaxID=4556 RepID=A0A4U6T1A8_SETVI|nr:hypothetical protein SEVIR_9G296100v2 [Setaria viridis]